MNRQAGMSRCGRGWATPEAAMSSKRGQTGNYEPRAGCPCGRVHLHPTQDAKTRRPARVDAGVYRHRVFSVWAHKAPRDTGPSRAVRALVLERDGFACARCGVDITGRPYSLQHRLRRSQGGGSEASNLVILCGTATTPDCHFAVDARLVSADRDRGYRVERGDDPRLIPVMYFSPGGSGFTRYLGDDGDLLECAPGEVA